jgi:hypothetical protein
MLHRRHEWVLESRTHDLPGAMIARYDFPQMRMRLATLNEAADER